MTHNTRISIAYDILVITINHVCKQIFTDTNVYTLFTNVFTYVNANQITHVIDKLSIFAMIKR